MPRVVRVVDQQRDGDLHRLTLTRSAVGIGIHILVSERDILNGTPQASRAVELNESELTAGERTQLANLFNAVEARIKARLYT